MDTEQATNEQSLIGPYQPIAPLGRGGMGLVYRARHTTSNREVALKIVKDLSPALQDSVRREILVLTALRHPGVVRIHDYGMNHGRTWYAMDLLEGENLRLYCTRLWAGSSPSRPRGAEQSTETLRGRSDAAPRREDAVPDKRTASVPAAAGELPFVLELICKLCRTLAFLHGEGFINCDLKPENILLVGREPVLIDFGLYSRHSLKSGRESPDAQLVSGGTRAYMSPEQIRGELLDARSDLYSLGCILYELIAGRPPFVGEARIVLAQHLSMPPAPMSQWVRGVEPELEELVGRLLSKSPVDRYAYADDVGRTLSRLVGFRPDDDVPAPQPYFYRASLVGRDSHMAQMLLIRDRATDGRGALVLVGGESGVGKTRFAIELTRRVGAMRVVTGENAPLPLDSSGSAFSKPLHSLRPLLRAVAYACIKGGDAVTRALLGHRHSVLAQYEPLLREVSAAEPTAAPVALGLLASRHRLFAYLAETLAAFATLEPVLLVLDDVGWADELTLAFLAWLAPEVISAMPVLILGTYRAEEASATLLALTEALHTKHFFLQRLGAADVERMLGEMLAWRHGSPDFAQRVVAASEGIPFFVVEYLRIAVRDGILRRDGTRSWQPDDRAEYVQAFEASSSLRELVERRIDALPALSRKLVLAAAVLGREAELALLTRMTGFDEETLAVTLAQLVQQSIFEPPDFARVRFCHDKFREISYSLASAAERLFLHRVAAEAIEARLPSSPLASESWAMLGHHFSTAGMRERAVRYLSLAAQHARSILANSEALSLYEQAISLEAAQESPESGALLGMLEDQADLLALLGQRERARERFRQALCHATEPPVCARLERKIGCVWDSAHEHSKALEQFAQARTALRSATDSEAHSEEFVRIAFDELRTYYWLGLVPKMDLVLRELEPFMSRTISHVQRSRFFIAQLDRNLRCDRYIISEKTLALARSGLDSALASLDESEIAATRFALGFSLLFAGQPSDAEEQLSEALASARRHGDLALQTRCLTYLTIAARMRGVDSAVVEYVELSEQSAQRAHLADYIACAKANRAWLALARGDFDEAEHLANVALDHWRSLSLVYALQRLALLPLLQVALVRRDSSLATSSCCSLLAAEQQPLPGTAADFLTLAIRQLASEDTITAWSNLESALTYLHQHDFL